MMSATLYCFAGSEDMIVVCVGGVVGGEKEDVVWREEERVV